MHRILNSRFISIATLLALLPTLSHAGIATSATVFFSPNEIAVASPIPALGDSMLMVLGLLISVIAIRVLRSRPDIHKLLGIGILGSGLLVGGLGVDRSLAGADFVITGGKCAGGSSQVFDASGGNKSLQNQCPAAIRITGYNYPSCPHDDPCPVGTVLQTDATCSLPACESS